MKTHSKLLPLIFLIAMGLVSCKKETPDEPSETDTNLYLKSRTFKDEMRVYTRDGEITDADTKAKALKSTGLDAIVYRKIVPNSSVVSFPTPEGFIWDGDSFKAERINDQYIITRYTPQLLNTREGVGAVVQFFKFGIISSASTPDYISYERKFVAYGDDQALSIGMLDIAYKKRDEQTGKLITNSIVLTNNQFNPASISTMGARDTLAVREYTYDFSKGK